MSVIRLNITWNHKKKQYKSSEFTIHNINRTEKPDNVELVLSMDALNVNDKAKMQLAIPSKSDFSFHAYDHQYSNQEMRLVFTDPLQTSQNLEGLIDIKGRTISQYKIIANTVVIYFKNESYGYFDMNILPGIKNLAGYPLKDSYTKEVFFAPPAPAVPMYIMHNRA